MNHGGWLSPGPRARPAGTRPPGSAPNSIRGGARSSPWRKKATSDHRSVLTSSVGRLFDAVAALVGLRSQVTYEGQAAIELEALARSVPRASAPSYPVEISQAGSPDGLDMLDPSPLIATVLQEVEKGTDRAEIAAGFHEGLGRATAALGARLARRHGLDTVALSGGVFQNVRFSDIVEDALAAEGLSVLVHGWVPPNDGGISIGQAVIAALGPARPVDPLAGRVPQSAEPLVDGGDHEAAAAWQLFISPPRTRGSRPGCPYDRLAVRPARREEPTGHAPRAPSEPSPALPVAAVFVRPAAASTDDFATVILSGGRYRPSSLLELVPPVGADRERAAFGQASLNITPSTHRSGICERGLAGATHADGHFPVEASEVVVGGTSSLGGDHARPDRGLRSARGAEHLALPRLDRTLQHFAALAGFRVHDTYARHVKQKLCVPLGELRL